METQDAWKKLDVLKKHPELADTPGYEIGELRNATDPVSWFFLLMEQPRFAPEGAWWFGLRDRGDLPWARLLAAQPQFEDRVPWESVSRLELVELFYLAPAIFDKHFPQGRPWDLYAFLTPREKESLLRDLPQLEDQVDWQELDKEWEIGNWMSLLADRPQFEKHFNWGRIEKKPSPYWDMLLTRQPQFARHCDFESLTEGQVRRIRKHQPQLFEGDDR